VVVCNVEGDHVVVRGKARCEIRVNVNVLAEIIVRITSKVLSAVWVGQVINCIRLRS